MSNVTIPQLPAATSLTGAELFPLSQAGATSQVTLALIQTFAALLAVPAGAIQMFAQSSPPVGWLRADGSLLLRATYPLLSAALIKSSAVTMTLAAPAVITWNAHPLQVNDPVKLSTTGALPTGFVAGTTYYVVAGASTANTFQLSATPGGVAVNTSGAQSGVHTAVNTPFGDGDGSTNFTLPDLRGEFVRGLDGTRGVDVSRVMGSPQAQQTDNLKVVNSTAVAGYAAQGAFSLPQDGSSTPYFRSGANGGTDSNVLAMSLWNRETRPRSVALLFCIKY